MNVKDSKTVGIIIAHPDDETLWAGGTILDHPDWNCFILSLCRANDKDRAPKFYNALKIFEANGNMADLDDGPEQKPLDPRIVSSAILQLLPQISYDLIISHDPKGEYTRHIRHEEVGRAVIRLWSSGKIYAKELWTFAYEDGEKKYLPRPIESATIYHKLSVPVWLKKYNLISKTYGFAKDSFEAQTTPRNESFWQFTNQNNALRWITHSQI